MATILSLETSESVCSAALHHGGQLLGSVMICKPQSHSEILNNMIAKLMDLAALKLKNIEAVAIAKGPGSYTGLRIGTSTAKGLCFALEVPLIAVNTLEAMAYGYKSGGGYKCPMIDARRMEVYSAVYDKNDRMVVPTQAVVLHETSFKEWLDEKNVSFLGSGADKFQKIMHHDNASFYPSLLPHAEHIGEIALKKFEKQQFEDVAYFTPFYLKTFKPVKPKPLL